MAVFTKRIYPESSYSGTWTDPDNVLLPGPDYATADSAGGQYRYHAYVIRSTIPNDALITAITVGTDADASLVGPSPAALAAYDIGQPGARTRIDTTTPVQQTRSIESVSMSAAHTAYIASQPGILRDTQITMRARIPPDTTGLIRIYRWWLDVTYEADSSDEVDIYPVEVGMIERPDWAGSWANFDHLISPKGEPAFFPFYEAATGNATGGLIFRLDSFPSSAEIVSVENHFRAKVDLDPSGNQSIGIGSYLAQMPGLESTAPRALVQVRASEFADYFVSYYGAQLQFFRDNPSFFRYGSLQNYVSRSSLGTVETIYNDRQFLRVRYTYEPGELQATFESSPDLHAALRLAGYLSADLAIQTELAAMLAPVTRELQARFESTPQLAANLTRAALLEAIFETAPHLEGNLRKVLEPIHGPQLRLTPAGARLVLMAHEIKQGDTAEPLTGQCLDVHGAPIDLTERTVTVIVSPRPGAAPIVERQAVVTDAAQGRWRLDWLAGETDRPGTYRVDAVLEDVNGDRQTVPGAGHGIITISRGLA